MGAMQLVIILSMTQDLFLLSLLFLELGNNWKSYQKQFTVKYILSGGTWMVSMLFSLLIVFVIIFFFLSYFIILKNHVPLNYVTLKIK